MTGYELIQLLITSPAIGGIVTAISGAIIGALFLRSNTSRQEFEKLKNGKLDEAVEDLLESGEMTYTELYKTKNYLAIAQKADERIVSEKVGERKYGNESFSFDWFVRFYEAAGNISNEEMQSLCLYISFFYDVHFFCSCLRIMLLNQDTKIIIF